MSKTPSHYDIWSDGSFRTGDSLWVGGAGWVIIHNGDETEGSRTISDIPKTARNHGSDIAEYLSVFFALNEIPAGSSVLLRLDAQNVIDSLKTGKLKTNVPFLDQAFAKARTVIESLGKIDIVKVSDRNNENIKRANILARTAASPSRQGK